MPAPTSDVSISDGSVEVTSGLYDTSDGIKLQVAGDSYPRIHLTPQGEIKSGDGTATPNSGAGGPVFVYDSDGTAAGNVYTDWSTLLSAVAAVEGLKYIYIPGDETLPTSGMPSAGWDLDGATLTGPSGAATTTPIVSFPDGCKLDPSGVGTTMATGLILYSSSSSSVVTYDSAGLAVVTLRDSAIVVSDTEAFFDVNHASAVAIFALDEGSGFHTDTSLTALGASDIANGDHPVVKIQSALLCQVIPTTATCTLATGTLEGAGDVTIMFGAVVGSGVSTTHSGVSGTITTTVTPSTASVSHTQADTNDWTAADGATLKVHLDELADRVYALENP